MSTNIEWTKGNKTAAGDDMPGKTWNPTVGCDKVSPGCRMCYAVVMAWRLKFMERKGYENVVEKLSNGKRNWTGQVNLLPERLLQPIKNKKPTTYFVDSMSDLFHPKVPFDYIDQVCAVMMLCPQHIFQVLTKQTDRMLEYFQSRQDFDWIDEAAALIVMQDPHLFHVVEKIKGEAKGYITNEVLPDLKAQGWGWENTYSAEGKETNFIYEGDWPARHIWLGTSIESQKYAAIRHLPLYNLHRMGWTTWVSNEPCLGAIDWNTPFFGFIDWMVTGGESGGSDASPMHPAWPRATRDFCLINKIPFFFKQWGTFVSVNQAPGTNSKPTAFWMNTEGDKKIGVGIAEINKYEQIMMLGKHKSGRVLDGNRFDQYPVIKPKIN